MTLKLRRLVIKPTLACTAGCPTCVLRLDLYEMRKREKCLTIDQWIEIIEDAYQMGCRDLHVSGGEPTLYPELIRLIETATRLEIKTNINTNGSHISSNLARKLANAGLNSITVSMYSWRSELHDQMRRETGLFNRAIQSIQYLQEQPNLLVDLQTILAGYNLLELDRFLEMAYELKVGNVYVSYVEGDVENCWLPTPDQIQAFRQETTPKIKQIIHKRSPSDLKHQTLKRVDAMFSDEPGRITQFSQGLYHPIKKPSCPRPYNFALVLVNGEVHPCNGVEYSHEPVMGNVHKERLPDLWQNKTWNQFRMHRHDWCHQCPMTLHFSIPIMGDTR